MSNGDHSNPITDYLQRHEGLIWRVANTFSRNAADREDLAQEISLHLWACREQIPQGVLETTYLYRVALNRAISWRRKEKTYQKHWLSFARKVKPTTTVAPPQALEHQSDIEQLYTAIRSLPEADRAIILLSFEQTTYAQMAEILGLSEAAVGQRLSRARKRLTQIFEKDTP